MTAAKTFMPLTIKALDDEELSIVNGGFMNTVRCPSCNDPNLTTVRIDGVLHYKCLNCDNTWPK